MTKVINNQDKVAKQINALGIKGVDAVGDDGNVCVQVQGNLVDVKQAAQAIVDSVGDIDTGDGVQKGCIFINADDCDFHDDLYKALID